MGLLKMIRDRLIQVMALKSAFTGLFWFTNDYSGFVEAYFDKEFTRGDVISGERLMVEYEHSNFMDVPYETPRGRISVYDGNIWISVGTLCPDSAIELVKKKYGLSGYGNRVKVERGYHWDKLESGISARVGVFWFTNDYSRFDECRDGQEIMLYDLETHNMFEYPTMHKEIRSETAFDLPRGRIKVRDGKISICVGTECPDSAIELVKKQFGLNRFRDRLEVVTSKFWDIGRGVGDMSSQARSGVVSSYVGLFWLNKEYSGIEYQVADKEFTRSDVLNKRWIMPDGEHIEYRADFTRTPRGRVGLEDGVVKIYVGTKCPESAIELIERSYGLTGYPVIVERGAGWNSAREGLV
jgi:hypothetical protein